MKKHLKYIDDTSDKFWQIEVLGNSHTVTYGRNGTSGTSQTKTFADNAECLKAAEKLLNEKIKKGYSENGEVIVSQSIKTETVKAPKAPKPVKLPGKDSKEILAEYDALVKSGNSKALLPFFEAYAKGNLEALKKQVKKNKRYWMTYVNLTNEPEFKQKESNWGIRGNKAKEKIILLSVLALFNKTDLGAWEEGFRFLGNAREPEILEVLHWAKPVWIAEYLLERTKKQNWQWFDYRTLRFLESEGLITYHPELFALSISSFNEWNIDMKTRAYVDYLVNDTMAWQRDIPELFNYETSLQDNYFRDNDEQAYNEFSTWELIYNCLLSEGKLSRGLLIEQSILIQTKEWSNPVKSFFRKRLTELNPQADELLPYQENLFACLHNAYAPIANLAIELIKKIYDQKAFSPDSFLDWLEPVMMGSDNKTAIRNILPVLEKMNKLYPELNKKITSLIADVYVVPDLTLQEKATKVLQKIAVAEDAELKDKLSGYTSLMQGNVIAGLSNFVASDTLITATTNLQEYHFAPVKEKVLLEEIELPENWNDIVFLFGKFITSQQPEDAEILLNSLITQKHLFPSDYSTQLQPYDKQLKNSYFESTYRLNVSLFLQGKIADCNSVFKPKENRYNKINTILLIKPILQQIDDRISKGLNVPLLSFPTHRPNWIAPKVLLERLINAQANNMQINLLDLSVAISRMPCEQFSEAIPLLDQLTGELKQLMAFCLGTTTEIVLKPVSVLNKLFAKIGASVNSDYNGVWAVAARTYYPEQTFPEFENTSLQGFPFTVAPFQPAISFKECWSEYLADYKTKEMKRLASWYELTFNAPKLKKAPDHLLYGLDMGVDRVNWQYVLNKEADLYFWHSLMPQNADPLAYNLLRGACRTASAGGKDLKAFLNLMNSSGFPFSAITMLVFACMFFQEKKDVRLMATEVMINLIDKQIIDLQLFAQKAAYLVSNKYGAFLRLADSLGSLKDVSALHNAALLQIMEEFFKHIDAQDKLPLNFKKMVEHYIDILVKTNQLPSPAAITFFDKWKDNTSIKGLVKQILK